MQALACGRPVLVTDIPGNREWVEPGVNGWLFEDGNVDDLAQKLIFAINEAQLLQNMSKAGRQIAEDKADWEKNYPKLLAAYEAVLEQA
jgi:glycosyltransferase involved in cell wall biosynthesis